MTNVPYETEETDADKVADRYVLRLMCLWNQMMNTTCHF